MEKRKNMPEGEPKFEFEPTPVIEEEIEKSLEEAKKYEEEIREKQEEIDATISVKLSKIFGRERDTYTEAKEKIEEEELKKYGLDKIVREFKKEGPLSEEILPNLEEAMVNSPEPEKKELAADILINGLTERIGKVYREDVRYPKSRISGREIPDVAKSLTKLKEVDGIPRRIKERAVQEMFNVAFRISRIDGGGVSEASLDDDAEYKANIVMSALELLTDDPQFKKEVPKIPEFLATAPILPSETWQILGRLEKVKNKAAFKEIYKKFKERHDENIEAWRKSQDLRKAARDRRERDREIRERYVRKTW